MIKKAVLITPLCLCFITGYANSASIEEVMSAEKDFDLYRVTTSYDDQAPSHLPTELGSYGNDEIGVGQEWVDVADERAVNTIYTNDTGKPIMVTITNDSDQNNGGLNFYVDGLHISNLNPQDYVNNQLSVIIPAASEYQVTGNKFDYWVELR